MSADEEFIKPELARELSGGGGAKAEPDILLLNELTSSEKRCAKLLEGIDGLTPSQLEIVQTQDFDSWEDFRSTLGIDAAHPAHSQFQRKVRKYARKRSSAQTSEERPSAEKKARLFPKTLETLMQTQEALDENDRILKAIEENSSRRRSGGSGAGSLAASLNTANSSFIKQLSANLQQTAVAFLKAAPDALLDPAPVKFEN
jgi:hypothetical protein